MVKGVTFVTLFLLSVTLYADVTEYNRVYICDIITINYSENQLTFKLGGTAEEDDITVTGNYNNSGFSFHSGNFKKVQTYFFKRGLLKKIIYYWEDLSGEDL